MGSDGWDNRMEMVRNWKEEENEEREQEEREKRDENRQWGADREQGLGYWAARLIVMK